MLKDSFGRTFEYLRLSVTDVCNFRCVYCLPNGYKKCPDKKSSLSTDEISNLASAFAELGLWKVRLTGGEPTTRQDIVAIIRTVKEIREIKQVALSTNGYRLRELAPELKKAGLDSLNISMDSLDPEQFNKITGQSRLNEVLNGISDVLELGFSSVKVNTVLLKELNSHEFNQYLEWIKYLPLSIRFIELMRTGDNFELFQRQHVSGELIRSQLLQKGWTLRKRKPGDGPALEFEHPDYLGRVGIIAPYSKDFCNTCNRLRVSSEGGMRLCLFGERDYELRPLLQSKHQKQALIREITHLIYRKEKSHHLMEGVYGKTEHFASIGG